MKYSLMQIVKQRENGNIDGWWIHDHTGTLESATMLAASTEKVNSNKIEIAVVDQVVGDTHSDPIRYDLERLDTPRTFPPIQKIVEVANHG